MTGTLWPLAARWLRRLTAAMILLAAWQAVFVPTVPA